MFFDGTIASQISINNIMIDIIRGKIYKNLHDRQSYINIHNLSIQYKQLIVDDEQALFTFNPTDNIYISQLTILYTYNATLHCTYFETISNSIINANCDRYLCINPLMFINNMGQ